MIKVSVIVPIYNVEKYLRRCLESLEKQTLQEIEIILVNDGSPDNSKLICEEFCKKNNKFKLINKENGGLSDARNCGINMASGEYIGFVDSDDFVEYDMFEVLYNNANKYNCDISVCGHKSYYDNGNIKINSKKNIFKKYAKDEAMDLFLIQEYFDVTAWNKIYRREIFENIRYPKGKIYEDIQTTFKLFNNANNGIFLDSTPKYFYYQRNDSISHSTFDDRMYWILDGINEYKKLCEINSIKIKYGKIGEIRWNLVIYNRLIRSNLENDKLKKIIKKMIRKNILLVIFNFKISFIRKIQILLFMFNTKLYKKIYMR